MVRLEDYRKRNVWFLEMGSRESKIKSTPRTPTRPKHGTETTVTSSHNVSMKPLQSTSPESVLVWPDSSVRWESLYDVYICHSQEEADCSYAMEMLSYLEQQPEKLRCFLPMRDMLAGSPIPSEMCSGLQSSHCWVVLLTSHFLSDSWCKYQMHQFLTQAPCSNGRLIPVMIGLPFSQYPSEMKHMYAFKSTLNDKSVFLKVKGAILTYLKEMIIVTSDQIPAHSPNSRTSESIQSSENVVNSQVESSVTQESTCDKSSRSSVIQENTSDISMKSLVTQELTSNMTSRSPMTQEKSSEKSLKIPLTQETTNGMYSRSPITQKTISEASLETLVLQETTIYRSMSNLVTQETISNISSRNLVTQETTSDMSPRIPVTQETTNDRSLPSSMTRHETTSEVSTKSSLTGLKTISMSTLLTTSDISMSSCVTRQENTSDMSMSSSVTALETTCDVSMKSAMTRQEATSDMSITSYVTGQETTSKISMNSSVARLETPNWLQDKYNISLSPQFINTRDVCTDCKCIMTATKDSFSQETKIDTSDSGIWSMAKDLHTDCNDLHTYGVQTASKYSHSDCSDFYRSRTDELTGQKDFHPQAVSSDADALHSDIYAGFSDQNSATCAQQHQCFTNR